MALSVGDLLGRKYEILEYLGRGSRGDVYLAEDRLLARKVAVKHLRPGSAHEQADVEHFLAEARTIARIHHENVIAIYDAIEEEQEQNYYLIMEYADEGTIADRLEDEKKLPVLETLEIGLAATRALEVVHAQGILHGDIKPSNILLVRGPEGVRSKLADFGLSRVITGDKDERPTYSGSILYSPPEQLAGEEVDQRADLYALGAVLYEMLTGQPPFPYTGKPEDMRQVFEGHLGEAPVPPSQLNPEVSAPVDEVILKALQKTPDERYPDARSMGQELRRALEAHREWQERVESAYTQGVEYEQGGEWEKAVARYEAALQEQPDHPEAQRRLEQARQALHYERLYRQGVKAYEQGAWAQAEESLSQVVSYDQTYAHGAASTKLKEARQQRELDRLYAEAKGHEADENWSQAVALYLEILKLQSDYKDVSARLAEAINEQKRQMLYEKAQEHLAVEKWEEAVKTLKELERQVPGYRNSATLLIEARRQKRLSDLYIRATQALKKGEWTLAAETFNQISQLEPAYKDAAVQRAIAERQARLADLYEQAQTQMASEEWVDVVTTLQEIHEMSSSYQDVERLLNEALEKRRIADLYQEGMRLYEQGEWEQAAQRLEEVQRSQPGYHGVEQTLKEIQNAQRVQTLYAQARQFEVEEDWTKAISAYSRILEMDRSHRDAKVGLARVSAASLGRERPSAAENRERDIAIVGALMVIVALSCMLFLPLSDVAEAIFAAPTQTPPIATATRNVRLCNGDFERNFECWQHGGELDQAVKCDGDCYAALGNPGYPCYGGVPVGEAWIKQTFQVPQEISPTLSLEYRVFSYDLDFPEYDYFKVAINGEALPQRYGNYEWTEPSCNRKPWDSGWRTLTLDLSAYRGEKIEVSLHNVNGTQPYYNTWTYVDNVRVEEVH
jgi:outer membrane protein assembly factor BamD (BamD/ComL family)/tRNA A-37 threonylcarbamoyl transferase component Bud32